MYLHGTSKINEKGHLEIGGVDTVAIAKKYGTPVFVYDTALIRKRTEGFQKAFIEEGVSYQVAYASKAFSCLAMIQLVEELGMSLMWYQEENCTQLNKRDSRWSVSISTVTIKALRKSVCP